VDVLPVQELTPEVRETAIEVFPVEDITYQRGWRQRRSPWFHRGEDDPTLEIHFWAAAEGEAELRVEDSAGRLLARQSMPAERGINTFEWDLLLDPELALVAEKKSLAGTDEDSAQLVRKKKKKKKRQAEVEVEVEEETAEGRLAKTPWAEALRLGRPLYITPGEYSLKVQLAATEAETGLEIKAPEPRKARKKKEPKIRGRNQD
jgi:hypothetical protein